jgi:RNA polymerase sigma-70 factor (ECF subfamily)
MLEQLISPGGDSDMAVFLDIYERYAKDIYRFALYRSGDEALAEDITSETFVRLWTSDEKAIRILTVKAYLFAIARHLFIDSRRSAVRHVEIDPQLAQPGDNPETRAIRRSELRDVMAQLQQMPEVDRAALLLHAQQEMSYEDIAQVLGISLAAVKVKIHRARLRLSDARTRSAQNHPSKGGLQ